MAMTIGDALKIADRAQGALPGRAAMGPNAPRAPLNKAADALSAKGPEIIAAMMAQTGATKAWAGRC